MKRLIIALAVLALIAGVASAKPSLDEFREVRDPGRVNWFWSDDLEPAPEPGWTHGDYTATAIPKFHVDTYLAWGAISAVEEESWGSIKAHYREQQPRRDDPHSWWCGTFDYDADGGYGNNWDERLDLPSIDWTGFSYPIIEFAYRNYTEDGYDFTYVDAESSGAYVHLNRGFDGYDPWGMTGFYLGNKDNPAVCRFRFDADGLWSDQDFATYGYNTVGGAFHCDEIKVVDYYTGHVFFYDDVETGGLCTPSIASGAGDYWHTIENNCKAFSDPTVWVCTQIDTPGYIPPGVQNWLRTPTVDFSNAATCTVYWVYQLFVDDNLDYWYEVIVLDGVETLLHGYYGNQCEANGPCDHFGGVQDDITALLPATSGYFEWGMYTSDDGASGNALNCWNAGIAVDDVGFFGQPIAQADESSWRRVKAMWKR